MKVSELILLQRAHHGPGRLRGNLGDGLLFAKNPFYRRVRLATLARGFRYTTEDPGSYFAFPLAALDTVLEKRRVPYRDNVAALERLERVRPGFFELSDLAGIVRCRTTCSTNPRMRSHFTSFSGDRGT